MTDTNYFSVKNDDFSIISDITDNTSKSSEKNKISKIDLTIIFDANLQKMKIIKLKNKCFINSIESVSKFTKQELVNILTSEFELLWVYYTSLNLSELRNICKTNYINGVSTKKKDDIISVIMVKNSTCDSMLFLGKNPVSHKNGEEPDNPQLKQLDEDIQKETDELKQVEFEKYLKLKILQEIEDEKQKETEKQTKLDFIKQHEEEKQIQKEKQLKRELKKQKELEKIKQQEIEEEHARLKQEEEQQTQLDLIKELEEEEDRIQKEKQLKRELKKQKELEKIKQQEIEEERARLKQEEEEQTQLDLIKQQEEESQLRKQKELEKIKQQDIKNKKQVIPKNIKVIVWNHYIGENIIHHRCLCCKKVLISNTSFHAGHVISEKAGGTHEINNLRPICASCNHSMGSENMVDFVIKYGLYIG
jgi:5-methylcytosine-specific restriction endonuclease McrA